MKELEKIFEELYEALEEDNQHTDTIILKCLELQRYDLIKELCDIAIESKKAGSLSDKLSDKRYAIYKQLKNNKKQ